MQLWGEKAKKRARCENGKDILAGTTLASPGRRLTKLMSSERRRQFSSRRKASTFNKERGEGRLVSLAAAEGHPASVMEMRFANQALIAF